MLEIIIDNTYPSSSLYFPTYRDEEGYEWEDTPIILLNEQQIKEFAFKFSISLAQAKEIIIAHELGHYKAWLRGLDVYDEELAWSLAPPTSLSLEKTEEVRNFCLLSYS